MNEALEAHFDEHDRLMERALTMCRWVGPPAPNDDDFPRLTSFDDGSVRLEWRVIEDYYEGWSDKIEMNFEVDPAILAMTDDRFAEWVAEREREKAEKDRLEKKQATMRQRAYAAAQQSRERAMLAALKAKYEG